MDIFNKFIEDYISPELKNELFCKKGTTWNHLNGDIVEVINFQKGVTSTDGSINFTINAGLYIEEIWKLCWRKTPLKFVHEEDCFPRFRIGFLLDNYNQKFIDKWWRLSNKDDLPLIGSEIVNVIHEKCLAFFRQFSSSADILLFIESKFQVKFPLDILYLSLLKYINGQKNISFQMLNKLINDKYWGKKASDILLRLRNDISE